MIEINHKESLTRKLKEDVKALEEYVKDFFEFLPLPICTVNPLNIVLGANDSFQDFTDYSALEVSGKKVEDLFLEKESAHKLTKEIAQSHSRIIKEMILLTKNNKGIKVNVYGLSRVDDDGNFIGYFLAFSDISELKQLQNNLEERVSEKTKDLENSRMSLVNILEDVDEARKRAEEERNKTLSIIANFVDGLLIFDEKSIIVLANAQMEDFSGTGRHDLIGRSMSSLKKMPFFDLFFQGIGAKLHNLSREEVKIRDNFVLEATTVPIIEQGKKIGTMLILHDITREKMTEKMKTEFVSLSAHQLRTPLSAIKWTLRMLLDEDMGKITKKQRDFIEKTYDSNERMIALINELLNITRIEEGRYLFKVVSGDIIMIINSIIKIYREDINKGKNVEIEFVKPKDKLPKIAIDIEKIQLAFQNIFDNAIRYNKKNGKVIVSLRKEKDEVEISVKDFGIGIPKEQQERVFTKFFRASNAMVKDTEGTGLGLFITKNIIEAHGGKIWMESKEGQGSTFYFTLPVKNKNLEKKQEIK